MNRYILAPLLLATLSVSSEAQLKLNFKRIINIWPTIELYYSVSCDGNPVYISDSSKIKIAENGRVIQPIEIYHPNPISRCSVSISLIFDVGQSMSTQDLWEAKTAASLLIERLDGIVDEASVIATHAPPKILQPITFDTSRIRDAVDHLLPGSSTLLDATYYGLIDLIQNGLNACRAVILFSNGQDSGSTTSFHDLVSLASRNRIRIYTLGFGQDVDSTSLQAISRETSGKFHYQPSEQDIDKMYKEISTIIFGVHPEGIILYEGSCPDGSIRTVDFSIIDTCSGSTTESRTYKSQIDTSSFTPLTISIPATRIEEDSTFILPVVLDPAIAGDSLRAARFVLPFDTTLLSFRGVIADSSTILQDSILQYAETPAGIEFTTTAVFLPTRSSLLIKLVFQAKAVTSVTQTALQFSSWSFVHGCHAPRPQESSLTIYPKGTLYAQPAPVPGSIVLHQNYPNPFNPFTTIEFELPASMHVRLAVFDALGREVRLILDERRNTGRHRAGFDAEGLPSGVYLYRLTTEKTILMKQMQVIR